MKKHILTLVMLAAVALCASATDLTGKRIYLNPGHGSFGPNDRPMATIPFPNLSSTGMPDTCGFYESNTNLWKCEYLRDRLRQAGATVVMSREQCGPWPYEKVNGEYPSYSWSDYEHRSDYTRYNKNLWEICEEVETGNYDFFLSVHSNATSDGTTTNYPIYLYRGYDNTTDEAMAERKAIGIKMWPYRFDMFTAGYDPASYYSETRPNVRGDVDFMGSGSNSTRSNGKTYYGYYGVLKHGVPGGLYEGYFHTYQPGRHRALNHDHCAMEGISYFRGIMDWFGADPDPLGYICGTVKDQDEKIVSPLFKYAARTNDQWLPCNGATVYLLSATGDTLQSYKVDSFYNGTFVFYNLQPGTYHLAAECEGYYPLDLEQRTADVVVEANKTTFPFLFLRNLSWEPEPIVYETYPDLSAGVNGLDGHYNFAATDTTDFSAVIEADKVVRQVLVRDDQNTFVLALDTAAKTSHIYRINTRTGALIENVNTEGAQGEFYPIYNIAFTADSILVGCNYGENQFDANQVKEGRTRGYFRTYYWKKDSLMKAPTEWFTHLHSGNFYNANVGNSFAVAGTLASATVTTDAMTIGSTHQFRPVQFVVDNSIVTSACYNVDADNLLLANHGDYTMVASPRADDRAIFMSETTGYEFGMAPDGKNVPLYSLTMPASKGGQAFKYGGQAIVAAPVVENGVVRTINLYNVSAGRAAAGVTTTNIADSIPADYYSVKPLAAGKAITLYLATGTHIYRYTTSGVTQPSFRNIYAYDLEANRIGDEAYELTFALNTEATAAAVKIYTMNDELVKTIPVENPALTGNKVTLPIPFEGLEADGQYKWSVEASAPEVGNWAVVEHKTSESMGVKRVFNAVNVYPETKHFGTIYLMNYELAKTSLNNGMLVMNPDLTLQNTTPINSTDNGAGHYRTPWRFGIDSEGTVYTSDWDDTHSGVYVVDPENPAGPHKKFFVGTSNSDGLWKNVHGTEMGSSTPSVYVYGTGADTKLLVYNEDPGKTLPMNGLCVYNIGQADGTIKHSWNKAPSAKIKFEGQLNTHGNVWGCSQGVWVSQHRSAGNNNSAATSLRFYTWNGDCTYKSYEAPKDEIGSLIIDGSLGSCFALSPDEKFLALRGTDSNIQLFDVVWTGSTPTLVYKGEMKNSLSSEHALDQLNWDYAGNLIGSGDAGVVVIAVPKAGNTCETPARSEFKLYNGEVPFDHCLFDPATSTLATKFFNASWEEETASTAVYNDTTGNIVVNINQTKTERWQAQVKLNTGLSLDEKTLYSLSFKMKANVGVEKVTVRMFENAVMLNDSNINLAAGEEFVYFADSLVGMESTGILTFDLGLAPQDAVIEIYDIAICEAGEIPVPIYDFLYEIGDNQDWKLTKAIELSWLDDNLFEGTFVFTQPTSYFAFITEKPASDDDWTFVKQHRFGGAINNELITDGAVVDLAKQTTDDLNLTAAPGTYTITVDLTEMTATIRKEDTGLENLNGETQVEKFFRNGHIFIRKDGHVYNLSGMLVE